MSEEAKLAYLQEKINEAKSAERYAFISFIVGLVFSFIAFDFSMDIFFQITSVSLVVIGIVLGFYYSHEKGKLIEQLKNIGFRIECPKCGKEITKGNFVFCPFCGAQLQD